MRKLRLYWVYLKAEWQMFLEYRGDIFIFTLDGIVAPLVGLSVWLSISAGNANLALSSSQLVFYFLTVFMVSTSTSAWGAYFIAEDIRKGDFSKYLTKPFGMFEDYAIRNIAEKIHKLIFIFLVNIILIFIFYKSFDLSQIHINLFSVTLFTISLFMGAIMYFLMDIIIGICAFWFQDIDFLRGIHSMARDLLSGKVIPLVLMPSSLSVLLIYSPYRYVVSFPVEIMLGKLTNEQLVVGFMTEISWLSLFLIIYKFLFAKGIKTYQGSGG